MNAGSMSSISFQELVAHVARRLGAPRQTIAGHLRHGEHIINHRLSELTFATRVFVVWHDGSEECAFVRAELESEAGQSGWLVIRHDDAREALTRFYRGLVPIHRTSLKISLARATRKNIKQRSKRRQKTKRLSLHRVRR